MGFLLGVPGCDCDSEWGNVLPTYLRICCYHLGPEEGQRESVAVFTPHLLALIPASSQGCLQSQSVFFFFQIETTKGVCKQTLPSEQFHVLLGACDISSCGFILFLPVLFHKSPPCQKQLDQLRPGMGLLWCTVYVSGKEAAVCIWALSAISTHVI